MFHLYSVFMKNIYEINLCDYGHFYSMADMVDAMRQSIKVICWGSHAFTNVEDKFLRFKVQAHFFKGWIYIGVNGSDLLDVFYCNRAGMITDEQRDVFV